MLDGLLKVYYNSPTLTKQGNKIMSHLATTILKQLTGSNNGTGLLKMMIGGKDFVYSEKENFMAFKFANMSGVQYNYCKITLNGLDLYNVELSKYNWSKFKQIRSITIDNVEASQLKRVFEEKTGLAITVPRVIF